MRSSAIVCAALAFAAAPIGILAQSPWPKAAPTPVADTLVAPSTTHHSIVIGGAEIPYRATWSEMVLKDEAGLPQATISATSYLRDDVREASARPVVFLFNGGPGASSSPLHFSAFGPRIRQGEGMIDNGQSLIDIADLVFIDPVGTGFSRELKPGAGRAYWNIEGDPGSVLQLIHSWIEEHGRAQSPLFVAGESYGGQRIALMAKEMGDLNLAGLILISPSLDMTGSSGEQGNDQPYIFTLPSMAVAAWTHGKVKADEGATVGQVWEKARAFAQSDYAVALQQGAALPHDERAALAKRMSELIGLPAETIAASDLRVETQAFLEQLLPGMIVGRLDARVAEPRPDKPINPDRPAAANDPSLGLGKSNVIRSESAASYFRDELGVKTTRDYFSLTLDVNFNWDWSGIRGKAGRPDFYFNATPNIAALMTQKPDMRVLLVSGYYDLAVPVLAQQYAITHGGLPLDKVDMIALPASHSPFDDPESLRLFSERVQTFVETQSAR